MDEDDEDKKPIPKIIPEYLREQSFLTTYIYNNMETNYYWSENWNPEFYIELAHKGFISVSIDHEEMGPILLPEIQHTYALLDWENLHFSRNVKKIISSGVIEKEGYYITIHQNFDPVIEKIVQCFKERNWISTSYKQLLHNASELSYTEKNFILHAVELRNNQNENLIAGEIGYTIGKTYTSLSGFFNREEKKYNHMGTIQLLTLAKALEKKGYAFWNLGHPQLKYKIDLGARELERADFLKRWLEMKDQKLESPLQEGDQFNCAQLLKPSH